MNKSVVNTHTYAVVTTTIRLRFDDHSATTRAADPLAPVTLTSLLCRRPHRAEALSDDARLTSDDVCLSVAYIWRNSRTERPRKTKIGTDVAHVTRDSDTTFKVKRSKVKVTRPLWLVVLAGQHEHTVTVTYPYAYMTYIVSPLAGLGGAYRGGRPPTACLGPSAAARS